MTSGPGPTPEARLRRTRAWLRYADRDLRHARALLQGRAEAAPYHVAFWAQQAAEKALKGALVWADVPFGAIHDLNALAARLPQGWQAGQAAGTLRELTLYATEARYPDLGEPEPTMEDARRAVEQAAAVQVAVRRDLETRGFPFPRRPPRQGLPSPEGTPGPQ